MRTAGLYANHGHDENNYWHEDFQQDSGFNLHLFCLPPGRL
ncbi:hypothetical protein C790_02060 [Morganella morganii SC01]|nr:hypothetical protein C790_02060 [Morganella morganii SC01]